MLCYGALLWLLHKVPKWICVIGGNTAVLSSSLPQPKHTSPPRHVYSHFLFCSVQLKLNQFSVCLPTFFPCDLSSQVPKVKIYSFFSLFCGLFTVSSCFLSVKLDLFLVCLTTFGSKCDLPRQVAQVGNPVESD